MGAHHGPDRRRPGGPGPSGRTISSVGVDLNRPGFDGGSDDTEGSLSWDRRSTPMSCASEPRGWRWTRWLTLRNDAPAPPMHFNRLHLPHPQTRRATKPTRPSARPPTRPDSTATTTTNPPPPSTAKPPPSAFTTSQGGTSRMPPESATNASSIPSNPFKTSSSTSTSTELPTAPQSLQAQPASSNPYIPEHITAS